MLDTDLWKVARRIEDCFRRDLLPFVPVGGALAVRQKVDQEIQDLFPTDRTILDFLNYLVGTCPRGATKWLNELFNSCDLVCSKSLQDGRILRNDFVFYLRSEAKRSCEILLADWHSYVSKCCPLRMSDLESSPEFLSNDLILGWANDTEFRPTQRGVIIPLSSDQISVVFVQLETSCSETEEESFIKNLAQGARLGFPAYGLEVVDHDFCLQPVFEPYAYQHQKFTLPIC